MSNTAANTAGMTNSMAMNVSHKPNWIVDTGATNHMASSLELLNKLSVNKLGYNRTVELPNGDETKVTHTGLSSISDGSTISNVLYVPEFKFNLLSVSKLTKELQCSASFFSEFFVLQDLFTGKVKEIGREQNGLYWLLNKDARRSISLAAQDVKNVSTDKINLWHKRLGHTSTSVLHKLFDIELTSIRTQIGDCVVCPCAKQCRLPFQNSSIKSK